MASQSMIDSLRTEARELRRMARNAASKGDHRFAERCKASARVKTQIANRKAKEQRLLAA